MSALSNYTITYSLVGNPGDLPSDIKIYIKDFSTGLYVLVHTEVNATVGITYTYPFNNLTSHTVYTIKVESLCQDGSTLFGDIYYLSNPTCFPFTVTAPGGNALDVTWDCWITKDGDSVKEYVIEYRAVGSPGPYTSVTIPIASVLIPWTPFPGTYPSYTHQIPGLIPGNDYEIRMSAVIEYDYVLAPPNPATAPVTIQVGPCPVQISPVVT